MTDTLDEKLKELIARYDDYHECEEYHIHDGTGEHEGQTPLPHDLDDEQLLAQIKQCFLEQGWRKTDAQMSYNLVSKTVAGKPVADILKTDDSLMTGQEWYEKFEKEYHNKADWIAGDRDMGDDAEHDVLLAARLAAGLTE